MKTSTISIHWRTVLLCLLAFTLSISYSNAQNTSIIQFQDESIEIEENIGSFEWSQMPESSRLADGYVGWVQFYQTPEQDVQDAFRNSNLNLINYISNHTYLFHFPANASVSFLQQNGVRAIVPVEGRFKLSQNLKNGLIDDYAMVGERILVTLQYHDLVSSEFVLNELATKGISLTQQYTGSNNIDLSIPDNCLEDLSNLPYVKWVELVVAPSIPDDTRGRGLHRASNLDTQGVGRNYTGAGIGVMVRDDGIVGPHIDFTGRIDNSAATGTGGTHGDGVAGIMTGAGNLDPMMRGMAAGSDVFVVNYVPNFLDGATQTLINNGDVQVTNSSYSNGCNAGYTTITETVDQQTLDIPTLLHVFSAGNSNNNDCGYGAGNQWGNITGGHKQGKNVIATANVLYGGGLVGSSSRGPAHDGRIKPDIAANGIQNSTDENNEYMGFGGTSGAAPGIAGVAAQLYEVYGDANGGALPPSALIKATLLNTANDAGNVGPDFKFGWGIVNALRAGILIEDGRYLSDNISQGGTNTHSIAVPGGTTQVRFMLYWSDAAASPGASPSLVNDLDLVVTDPSSGTTLPWILDHTPDPALLDLPATNGPDHLNNVEQVLINNPAAGTYDLDISGFNVPDGPQEYFIVYEIIQENLTLTYPNAGESFVPGEEETLHWDAINTTAGFTLEYSTDNGGTWNAIDNVGASVFNYDWTVPADVSGECLIRVTSGSFQDQSDGNFSIVPLVTNVSIAELCLNETTSIWFATYEWDAVPDAENYDFYRLGAQYMEIDGNSTTNSITLPIADPDAEQWFGVVANNNTEGWQSRRSIAEFYGGGLIDCALSEDLNLTSINSGPGDFTDACGAGDGIVSITITNDGSNPQSNFDVSYQLSGSSLVQETFTGTIAGGESADFDFATLLTIPADGVYTLTTNIILGGDLYPGNNTKELDLVIQLTPTPTPYSQNFNQAFPFENWVLLNPDNDITWVRQNLSVGSSGGVTFAGYMNNYDYNAPGEEDAITTELFDLSPLTTPYLTFDLAKAQFSAALSDALRVEISIDCGITFTTIYEKDGLELSTLPSYNTSNEWAPGAASQWRIESVDLIDYAGESAIFRFVNINGYGNSTYLDNITVDDFILATETNEVETIALFPNPADNQFTLRLGAAFSGNATLTMTNSVGQTVKAMTISSNETVVDVSDLSTGIYFVSINTDRQSTTKKLLIK